MKCEKLTDMDIMNEWDYIYMIVMHLLCECVVRVFNYVLFDKLQLTYSVTGEDLFSSIEMYFKRATTS